jgi:hypothetical protein
MARYTINYLTGDTETVEADGVEYDADRHYTFTRNGKQVVALTPVAHVRSIVCQDDPKDTITYPHQDGDITVLGPEVFASADGEAISWKGAHYTRRPYPTLGKVTG